MLPAVGLLAVPDVGRDDSIPGTVTEVFLPMSVTVLLLELVGLVVCAAEFASFPFCNL